ncbi:hypothetical protein [Microlunatus flavus]|uniref:Uncharacterized protein n=1 Tax=Microlunatus flavus TaxID=1036181 RepID=A0A1H9G9L4_9ACTN|nr:hypothetical protein [Microlunatus flavus]SEQ46821.1 hypothetical protein SAMN05421756_103549 [Microlunatus flavus]
MTALRTEAAAAPAAASTSDRLRPWAVVVTLAVLLGYADGFWLTTLRTAVGDISRVQEPATSYWRTTTAMLPAFAAGTLAGLLAVRRWSGPGRPEPGRSARRGAVLAGLGVVLATTLVAVGLAATGSAYDYHLQSGRLSMMQGMQHDCDPGCQARQQWMTIAAHARAVAWTGVAVLATNAVLVTWLAAVAGGRRGWSSSAGPALAAGGRERDLRVVIVAALLGAGVVHAVVVPEHLEEWWAAGTFFVVLTAAELVAAAVVLRPGTAGPAVAAAVSAVPLVVWTVSRTAGLPFGPEAFEPEAVGVADVVACLLELATLVAALLLLRRRGGAAAAALTRGGRTLAVLVVVAVGALGVVGAAPDWFDGVDGGDAPAVEADHHHG